MSLSRRGLFQWGAAAGASLLVPARELARRGNHIKPAYSLTGGASTDGALVNSTLSPNDAHRWVDLAVSRYPNMAGASFMGQQQSDSDSIVRHVVTGRSPDTTYYARLVNDGSMIGETVRFKTMPVGSTSWTRKIAVVSCMANAADQNSTQLAWADVLSWAPDDMWHLGDWGYWGQLIPSHASYRRDLYHYLRTMRHFETMRRAIQSAGLNAITISDHELTVGGDPEHGMHDSPASIRELVAFQKLMPVRTYGDTRYPKRGRYYSYDIGEQVRVIVTDFRSPDRSNSKDKDGPNKTMFGATQLAWLLDQLDSSKVNLIVNETAWLGDPNQDGRAKDKPWYYNYEQQVIVDYIHEGGYQVAWIGGDRHYIGYLAGGYSGVHNTLGNFPCYISSGMAKDSLVRQGGELMTWEFGADQPEGTAVCGYMQLTLSYNSSTHDVTLGALGRAVLDTSKPKAEWVLQDIPGGTATNVWRLS